MGFAAEPVNPSRSTRHLLGAALRHWRADVQKLSLAAVASQALVDASNLAKWERGERDAPPDAIRRIDPILGANGFLIALHSRLGQTSNVSVDSDIGHAGDMDMVRRQLLATLATVGGVAALPVDALERLRDLIGSPAQLDDWEEIVQDYAHAIRAGSLAEVIPDLALDVVALQRAQHPTDAGWARVNTQMAFLLAMALGFAGQTRESRHWWITARRTAEDCGDERLISAARAYEAMQGLYEQRPLGVVLARSDQAVSAARATPCAGLCEALAARAQVLAVMGDEQGARAALDEQARIYDQLPGAVTGDEISAFGWPATRMLHSRSFASTYGGYADAGRAQQEVLQALPPGSARARTQIRFHEALTQVRKGNLLDGLDHARNALAELPEEQHTRFVRYTAATVLDAVPRLDQLPAKVRPAVTDYRESLALPALPERGA